MAATEYRCRVKSFKMLTPTVFEITFDAEKNQPEHPDFQFEGGQFVSVIIPGAGPNGRDLRRAYSIASGPKVRPTELCVKLIDEGPGTRYLYHLREGDFFRGVAPYGDFTYEPKNGRNVCMIATGTGIAPFRSFVFSEAYQNNPPPQAWCLLGVRGEEELMYQEDMSKIAGLQWISAVTHGKDPSYLGFRGRVTDWLRTQGSDFPWQQTEFYLCGNGAMIAEVKSILAEKGVQKESILQEKYY